MLLWRNEGVCGPHMISVNIPMFFVVVIYRQIPSKKIIAHVDMSTTSIIA